MSNEMEKAYFKKMYQTYGKRYGHLCVYKGTLDRFNKLKIIKNLRTDELLNRMIDEFTKGDESDTTCIAKN